MNRDEFETVLAAFRSVCADINASPVNYEVSGPPFAEAISRAIGDQA